MALHKMRIALVTNWDEHCAVAEYARNLTDYCTRVDEEVSFKVVTRPLTYEAIWERVKDVDVIHFNYCAHAFSQMDPSAWKNFQTIKPVVMTVHESTDWMVRRLAKTEIADKFVMHDKFRDGMPAPENVVTIPYGVPEVDISDVKVERKVGTFGCAFPWKGLLPLAYACGQLEIPLDMYLSEPDSDKGQMDWRRLITELEEVGGQIGIWKDWQMQKEIIRKLASCAVIALPFDPCSPITGISASVRLALAAKRPLVLTKFFHFADLFDFDEDTNDIWWVEGNLEKQLQSVMRLFDHGCGLSISDHLYNDMKWSVAAQKYVELYKTVRTKEAVHAG
jgi:hypothetical protein